MLPTLQWLSARLASGPTKPIPNICVFPYYFPTYNLVLIPNSDRIKQKTHLTNNCNLPRKSSTTFHQGGLASTKRPQLFVLKGSKISNFLSLHHKGPEDRLYREKKFKKFRWSQFWPLESDYLMGKSEKKGLIIKRPLLGILRLTYLELSYNFRLIG